LLVADLAAYSAAVNDLWAKGILTEANIEQAELFDLPFSHRSNMHIRMNAIR